MSIPIEKSSIKLQDQLQITHKTLHKNFKTTRKGHHQRSLFAVTLFSPFLNTSLGTGRKHLFYPQNVINPSSTHAIFNPNSEIIGVISV